MEDFLIEHPLLIRILRLILAGVVGLSIALSIVFISHATWYPQLLQQIANNFDKNSRYEPADQEYLQMLLDSKVCFRNTDCQIECPTITGSDCNSYGRNIYSQEGSICTEINCKQQIFTYTICENNKCKIKGF